MFELQELCRAFRESDAETLRAQAEYLAGKRLAHPSAEVKSKCLRAIKFCCGQPGMQSLRSAIQPHLAGVRACLSHTGPPHALRGDAPHRIVRELAAEALRAATLTEQQAQAALPGGGGGMPGFGTGAPGAAPGAVPAASAGGGGGPALAGQVMEGFGSAPAPGAGAAAAGARPRAASWGRSFGGSHGPRHTVAPPASPGLSGMSAGQPRGGFAFSPGRVPAPQGAALGARGALAVDGARIVREFCTPRGLRRQVTGEDVRLFVQGVSQGDGGSAAAALREALGSGNPQSQNRALVGLHALLERGSTPSCARLAEDFDRDPAALEALARGAPQEALRARAAAVLGALKASAGSGGAGGSGGAAPAAGAPVPLSDLLGPDAGGGGGGSDGGGEGLFSGMALAAPAGAPALAPAAAPASAQGGGPADLLGDLGAASASGGGPPSAPAQAGHAGAGQQALAGGGLLGAPVQASPVPPQGDLAPLHAPPVTGGPGLPQPQAGQMQTGQLQMGQMPMQMGQVQMGQMQMGQMPMQMGQMQMGQMQMGQMPVQVGQMPMQMGQMPVQLGQVPMGQMLVQQPLPQQSSARGSPRPASSPKPQKPAGAFDFVGEHIEGLRK